MKKTITTIACTTLLCTACGGVDGTTGTEVEVGTGAVLNTRGTDANDDRMDDLSDSTQEELFESDTPQKQAVLLRLSYDNAVVVRDTVAELSKDMDPDIHAALEEALADFSNDIDALKQYVDRAEHGDITDDDSKDIAQLSANIEEEMSVFAQMIDLMF